jgi:tRNA dimethylallyltransferase
MAGTSDQASAPAPWYLSGPTAVGKSEVALLLAEQQGGEIISMDSMQVYRGLDLGTAKPTDAERARVPHHLIDVAELSEPFDAAKFIALAQAAIADIQRRGRRPILCGGTGLYFKALLEGLGESPPSDARLRAELEQMPLEELLRELALRDAATFQRIDQKNPRRVVRALEVIRLTGRPYSEQRTGWAKPGPPGVRLVALSRDAAVLRQRTDARVDIMFASGLMEETRQLMRRGLADNKTAMQAIGYRQCIEHLRGERSLPETVALVKQKTWQFAKRQMTWLRHQLPVQWLAIQPGESAASVAARFTLEDSV